MANDLPSTDQVAEMIFDGSAPPDRFDEREGFRSSAVLVPLLEAGGEPSLLFTRRSSQLPHHRGQVAFPGGLRETEDRGPFDTALREAEEEVGVDPASVRFLTSLQPTETLREFRIHPFVSHLPRALYEVRSHEEVERIFTVPLSWLLDTRSQRQVIVETGGLKLSVPAFPFDGEIIWGATFRMTQEFLSKLRRALV